VCKGRPGLLKLHQGTSDFKLLSTNGQDFGVFLRLYRKIIVTAAYDSEFDITEK
jgi:hypothetical protein